MHIFIFGGDSLTW